VAEPEKALLDQLYMVTRGLSSLAWDELDLSSLDGERLQDYATRFPTTVRAAVSQMD